MRARRRDAVQSHQLGRARPTQRIRPRSLTAGEWLGLALYFLPWAVALSLASYVWLWVVLYALTRVAE